MRLHGWELSDNLRVSGMADEKVPRHSYPRHLAGKSELDMALTRHDKCAVWSCRNGVRVLYVACCDNRTCNGLVCARIDDTASCTGMICERKRKDAAAEKKCGQEAERSKRHSALIT